MFVGDFKFTHFWITNHDLWTTTVFSQLSLYVAECPTHRKLAGEDSMRSLKFHSLEEEIVTIQSNRLLVDVTSCILNSALFEFILWFVVSGHLNSYFLQGDDDPAVPNIC